MRKFLGLIIAVLCWMGLSVSTGVQAGADKSAAVTQNLKGMESFRDCSDCPDMLVIPAGNFVMGSGIAEIGRSKDEIPLHQVNIRTFALGKTEITLGQFSEFVKDTGYSTGDRCWTIKDGKYEERSGNWRKVVYQQDNSHPVICIAWEDASAYAAWLSRKTGKQYRLPTEAEWEYAARAKTLTSRYWGESPDAACKYANSADKTAQKVIKSAAKWLVHNCKDGYAFSAPSGSFSPNTFGLHDMLGNVWEWVEDSYHDNYQGAPVDGSVWKGNSKKHILRGGSWYDSPRFVRAAGRDKAKSARRYDNFGFRIARTLP